MRSRLIRHERLLGGVLNTNTSKHQVTKTNDVNVVRCHDPRWNLMIKERRLNEREKVNLAVHWEGEKGRCNGVMNDLSIEGCFVLGASQVTDGELVRLEIEMPRKKVMVLWGEVTNHLDEIGFGMRFTNTGTVEMKRLKRMIDRAREKNSVA